MVCSENAGGSRRPVTTVTDGVDTICQFARVLENIHGGVVVKMSANRPYRDASRPSVTTVTDGDVS